MMLPNMIGRSSLVILCGSFVYNKTDFSNLVVSFFFKQWFLFEAVKYLALSVSTMHVEPMLYFMAD